MEKCGRAKCLRDLEIWPGEMSTNEKIWPAEMSANHAFHSQTFRRLQKPKCLRESEMRPAEMSVNEEFQKPKCLSALRAPPVAERFGASISGSHRHFDRCIFSFADISAEPVPGEALPGASRGSPVCSRGLSGAPQLPGLPGASREPPGSFPGVSLLGASQELPRGLPGSPKDSWSSRGRFPGASSLRRPKCLRMRK